ncbi:MAG: BolA family transcriptional regulator [Gammaproteobacteria bacterium]|uniref:BolA family transcriptional regulator n=1 Tax=Candidatus Thiopontia autotrophica TaxID=2841688 RepID=A0A8J6P0U1_9GAMM|nr:BolA family transcriptional regulator [Candidatus Thiopontia autotrophica]MBL6969490.1 BolA family transcriptional regulator [Gammaproteobacteria bacterium]
MTAEERIKAIHALLSDHISPTFLEIEDNSDEHAGHKSAGGAGHYTVHIASPLFAGKNMLQQHRLVYSAVEPLMDSEIHALSIKIK